MGDLCTGPFTTRRKLTRPGRSTDIPSGRKNVLRPMDSKNQVSPWLARGQLLHAPQSWSSRRSLGPAETSQNFLLRTVGRYGRSLQTGDL